MSTATSTPHRRRARKRSRRSSRAEKLFEAREPDLDDEDLTIAQTYAASTRSERHAPDDDPHDFGVQLATRRKARIEEWDLDAEVCVREHERDRLEQLCRYLLRPPLALDRLCPRCDGWLQFVAVLHDGEEARHLLEHLYLWSEPKPLHPARGPPDAHETFDFP